MKPLIVIPARGGSKGIPRKNIKLLNGKPLINYTIEVARQLFDDNCICVTTDDEEIKRISEKTGLRIPFLRPKELATDLSGTYEVLLNAVTYYENSGYAPDTLILLQPTSPFRTADHIKEALKEYTSEIDMVVSVKESKANPYYNLFEENKEQFLVKSKTGNYFRRQDCPKVWEFNGAIYIINIQSLKIKPIGLFEKIVKYEMNEKASLDIDTMLDWVTAESILKNELTDTI